MPPNEANHETARFAGRLKLYFKRAVRERSTLARAALGFALGSFIGVFPSFLIGSPLALFLAGRLRIHRGAAVAGTLLMNPITAPLFYSISTFLGAALLGDPLETAAAEGVLDRVWRVGPAFLLGNTVFAAMVSLIAGGVAFVIMRGLAQEGTLVGRPAHRRSTRDPSIMDYGVRA